MIAANQTLLGDIDLHLFNEGTHTRLYEKLGAHPRQLGDRSGTSFSVWAPNAEAVSVIGDFNDWDRTHTPMRARGSSGLWEAFVPGVGKGTVYKYFVQSRYQDYRVEKADPFAFYTEQPPHTASIVWEDAFAWGDQEWMRERGAKNALDAPMSIYELHLGSWRRVPAEDNRPLTYRELAPLLVKHVQDLGFTHVELLPITEHPYYGSWGYQTSAYFAPTSRYGDPEDLKFLIDHLHQNDIGVILDWVPSHFPEDEYALQNFDGTHLYEHADPRLGHHPDWGSAIFNYGRNEVRSFLLSSACFWLDRFHIDGLRVDAVASMLYLDYSRKEGEWIPNVHGGRENLQAMGFLRELNRQVYLRFPDVQTIAEESTAWPMVSRPLELGGLGFGLKWDMGWMHDTLLYMSRDPIHRQYHHGNLTFRAIYAGTENFVLPLSHDEVVHGKGSLLAKMPGDEWQQFANLRLLFAYMFGQTGKKLIFMGGELGQRREWNHDSSLDWHLLALPRHGGLMRCVGDLNRLYRELPALHALDCERGGFSWLDANDSSQSILSFVRNGREPGQHVLCVFNFTPLPRQNYRIGAPSPGRWREALNTDATIYGGSGVGNLGAAETSPIPMHGHWQSLSLTLPPLGALFLAPG